MAIHPKRVALLHVAKKQLGLTDDDYRAMLSRAAGVNSAADLSDDGFQLVVFEFERLGFRSTKAKTSFGHRRGFASPAQVAAIRSLWREWRGEDDPGEAALNAWLTKFHKVSALRFVSADKVTAVLVALKSMVGRKRQA